MPRHHLTVDVSPGGDVPDLATAIDRVRALREPGRRAEVLIAPGRYPMDRPLRLGPEDSGTTFTARDPGDVPVLDGSVVLRDWTTTEVNGVTMWQSPAPKTTCRSLFVGGERCPRPRFPREDFLRIADQAGLDLGQNMVDVLYQGSDRFGYREGDAWQFHDLEEVEAVVLHYWVEERMPLTAIDQEQRIAHSSRTSIFALRDDLIDRFARYYWDNVYEALGEEPGEWYLDRQQDRVLYVPRISDRIDSFEAHLPVVSQFAVVHGRPETGELVRDVRFEGLSFEYADRPHPLEARVPFLVPEDGDLDPAVAYASAPQAAANVDGAIEFAGVRDSSMVDCRITRIGGYAVDLGDGCQDNLVGGNTMLHLGAGGVKLHGSAEDERANRRNTISDNIIGHGGELFPPAVGILVRHSAYNTIAHNEIHHLLYSGISVGWIWGYAENPAKSNLLEHNHIHHLGAGLLNDMGGIYLLGVQPGTVIRGNLIHDIERANYGGWAIYLDQGGSDVLIEGNVCHDVDDQCYHQHFGRENIVRNNIFAFGRRGQVEITLIEDHVAFTLEHNIMVGDGEPAITGRSGTADVREYRIRSDRNLYWDIAGDPVIAGNRRRGTTAETAGTSSLDDPVSNGDWTRLGHDEHSRILDPGLTNLAERRFDAADDTALRELGIALPDISNVGVRPKKARSAE